MVDEGPTYHRQWRDYRSARGARPIRDFLVALPDEDRATIFEEMEHVRKEGTRVARHLRGDIYEMRVTHDNKAYRLLFASVGRFDHILLSLEGFQKKTQRTPLAKMELAERRLADWQRRGEAKKRTATTRAETKGDK